MQTHSSRFFVPFKPMYFAHLKTSKQGHIENIYHFNFVLSQTDLFFNSITDFATAFKTIFHSDKLYSK